MLKISNAWTFQTPFCVKLQWSEIKSANNISCCIISFTRIEGRDHSLWNYEEKVSGNQCHKTTSTDSKISSETVRNRAGPGDHSGKVLPGKTHETTAVSLKHLRRCSTLK